MSGDLNNAILEYLRDIRKVLGEVKEDTADLKLRVGLIEAVYASLSLRLDRLAGNLELVKRRLGMHGPPL